MGVQGVRKREGVGGERQTERETERERERERRDTYLAPEKPVSLLCWDRLLEEFAIIVVADNPAVALERELDDEGVIVAAGGGELHQSNILATP